MLLEVSLQTPESFVLRYRDLATPDAVKDHQDIIARDGYTWWGWWKKADEKDYVERIVSLGVVARAGPLQIGIFNNATRRFFKAQLTDCVGSDSPIASPEIGRTPSYYAEARLPGWFKLSSIEEITELDFINTVSEVPIGETTFFEVSNGRVRKDDKPANWIKIKGSTILHISDVHLGSDFAFPSKEGPGAVPLIDVILRDTVDSPPGAVIISGDITTRADANVLFNEGLCFLNTLVDRLNLVPDQVIIVPGNHDIPLSKFSPHDYSHEIAFKTFLNSFYKRSVNYPEVRHFILGNGLRLQLMAMNSVRLRRESEKNFGYVQWALYEDVLKVMPHDPATLRIAVLHHHLVSAPREEVPDTNYPEASISVTVDAGAVIAGLQRHHFRLALHGHQHVPAATSVSRGVLADGSPNLNGLGAHLTVVAAGSAGAGRLSDEMRDNSYNILKFNVNDIEIEARRYNPGLLPSTHFRLTLQNHASA
jgi:3',5'-cyclic AMP phosphodiesterase CpdA